MAKKRADLRPTSFQRRLLQIRSSQQQQSTVSEKTRNAKSALKIRRSDVVSHLAIVPYRANRSTPREGIRLAHEFVAVPFCVGLDHFLSIMLGLFRSAGQRLALHQIGVGRKELQ